MTGSEDWEQLTRINFDDYATFDPQGFDEAGNWLYALMPYDGRQALFKIALDGNFKEALVFAHDTVDVDGLVTFGRYDRPVEFLFNRLQSR